MKVLVACEESQEVCKAFRDWGMRHIPVIFKNQQAGTRSGISWAMRSRPSRGGN